MTTKQIKNRTKTVTRRWGWKHARVGDRYQPVEKCQGLRKGEKIKKIGGPIEVVSTGWQPLAYITQEDCILEGFPDLTPLQFVTMLLRTKGGAEAHHPINRIEFKYVDENNQ